MKKTFPFLFCFIIITTLSLTSLVNATAITVSINANNTYNRMEHTNLSGVLTQDGSAVTNGLVAYQITSPNNDILTLRTLNTGSNPQNQIATVQSVYLSNLAGNQLNTASKGDLAYFQASVTNNDQQAKNVLIAISVYDNYNSPVGFASSTATIQGRETRQVILGIPMPSAAAVGMARVFAGAYSSEVNFGGVPYCAERSSTFAINVQQGNLPPDTQTGSQGTYTLPITIPVNAAIGTYTIYASSSISGLSAFASKTIAISQTGDFNADGKLDASDITNFVLSYIHYWNSEPFNPLADLDHNGAVNVNDISQFCIAYIQYWSWQ
jgi:hypothetical protein